MIRKQMIEVPFRFEDRITPQDEFKKLLNTTREVGAAGSFLLNYWGIAGIGKTTLIDELCHQLDAEKKNVVPYVRYDFQFQSFSEHAFVLSMRNVLKSQQEFSFDRLDMAERIYSYKTGEPLKLSFENKSDTDIIPYLDVIFSTLENVIPQFGIIETVGKAVFNFAKNDKEKVQKKVIEVFNRLKRVLGENEDEVVALLHKLKSMTSYELLCSYSKLFIEDLNDNLKDAKEPLVVFIDTYEKLINTYGTSGNPLLEDEWLRNKIIAPSGNVLWVIFGRERLEWETIDPNIWKGEIVDVEIVGFEDEFVERYLDFVGVEHEFHPSIKEMSSGTPIFLHAAAKYYLSKKAQKENITVEDIGRNSRILINNYVRYMDDEDQAAVKLYSILERWTKDEAKEIGKYAGVHFTDDFFNDSVQHSIIKKTGEYYSISRSVARIIRESMTEEEKQNFATAKVIYLMSLLEDEICEK